MQRDVITLQFGSLANFTGAHFWNIQDELLGLEYQGSESNVAQVIDSSVLYVERQDLHGSSSYTPRLLIFDAKGSLGGHSGHIRSEHQSSLLPTQHAFASAAWDGKQEVHRAVPIPKSQFIQQLEEEIESYREVRVGYGDAVNNEPAGHQSPLEPAAAALDSLNEPVEYFTDYLKAPLHPRSMYIMENLWRDSPELNAWSIEGGWLSTDAKEEAADRIRVLVEESDFFTGFQCFVDDTHAWGGVSSQILEEVRDDYGGSKTVFVFGLRNHRGISAERHQATNDSIKRYGLKQCLSTAILSQLCDVYLPLQILSNSCFSSTITWAPGNMYHESAILATAIDNATVPYRIVQHENNTAAGSLDMLSLAHLLTGQYNSPLAMLRLSFPCPNPSIQSFTTKNAELLSSYHSYAGNGDVGHHNGNGTHASSSFAESTVLRGLWNAQESSSEIKRNKTTEELLELLNASLVREGNPRRVCHRTIVPRSLAIPLPFPAFFSHTVAPWGEMKETSTAEERSSWGRHVESCPVLTRLFATKDVGPIVGDMARQWTALGGGARGQATLDSWGIDREMGDEVKERLVQLSLAYGEEYR